MGVEDLVAVAVRVVEARQQVRSRHHRLVARRLPGLEAGLQALDAGMERRGHEQRHRVAVDVGRVDDAVRVGDVAVVGPDRHQVAEVHHDVVLGYLHVDPRAIAAHDLQAADAVVGEHGDAAVVGVRAAPELAFGGRQAMLRWVVDHAEVVQGLPGDVEEVVRREPEGDRHAALDTDRRLHRLGEVLLPRGAEAGEIGELIGSVQRRPRHDLGVIRAVFRPAVDRFLEIAGKGVGVIEGLRGDADVPPVAW